MLNCQESRQTKPHHLSRANDCVHLGSLRLSASRWWTIVSQSASYGSLQGHHHHSRLIVPQRYTYIGRVVGLNKNTSCWAAISMQLFPPQCYVGPFTQENASKRWQTLSNLTYTIRHKTEVLEQMFNIALRLAHVSAMTPTIVCSCVQASRAIWAWCNGCERKNVTSAKPAFLTHSRCCPSARMLCWHSERV